jgi:hypothetical protein
MNWKISRRMRSALAMLGILVAAVGAAPSSSASHLVTCGGLTLTHEGGAGDDLILGGPGNDVIWVGAGNDVVFGYGGDDRICGGSGDDVLFGGTGNDRLYGDAGADSLLGEGGNDRLDAETGDDGSADQLSGGDGADLLVTSDGVANDSGHAGNNVDTCDKDAGEVIAGCELSPLPIAPVS